MARLIACHTCTKQVSTDAFTCPHCGQTFARPWLKLAALGILTPIAWAICTEIYAQLFLLDETQAQIIEATARLAFARASIENQPFQPNTDYYTFHQFPYEDRKIITATPKHYHNLHSLMYVYPDFLVCRSDNPSRQPLAWPYINSFTEEAECPSNSSPLQ